MTAKWIAERIAHLCRGDRPILPHFVITVLFILNGRLKNSPVNFTNVNNLNSFDMAVNHPVSAPSDCIYKAGNSCSRRRPKEGLSTYPKTSGPGSHAVRLSS